MSDKLTSEQIQAKADELTEQLKVKVTPIEFYDADNDEQIVGYIQEPARITKFRVLDKITTLGAASAAMELLDICLIKEHSNPRLFSESPKDDAFYLGASMRCIKLVRVSEDIFKKKVAEYEIDKESFGYAHISALIRGCLHVDSDQLDDEQFARAWCQTKYYLSTVHQVKFENG